MDVELLVPQFEDRVALIGEVHAPECGAALVIQEHEGIGGAGSERNGLEAQAGGMGREAREPDPRRRVR